jgi:zinc protease
MKKNYIFALFYFVAFLFLIDAKELVQDPRLTSGKLSNGVTWIYRQHSNPPGRMALMLHVRTGSLNETDAQKGLAHFMEHMVFNGTEHFPPGKLVPYFESLGMQFGADLNAFTSFDETAYMLFLPDAKDEGIDKALMVLSDYAFRASLLPEEIQKERGVILEEARGGKGPSQRLRDKLWPQLFEGSLFAQRLPIGDEKIISEAQKPEFENYYHKWYRPENVTVLLVGDRPVEGIQPLIEKWFGSVKGDVEPPKPTSSGFKPFTKERAIIVTDSELTSCQISIENLEQGRPPAVTSEQWRVELLENIGSWIMSRRLDELIKKGKLSSKEASVDISDFFHDAISSSVSSSGEAKDWKKMLQELIVETDRADQFGFTQRELDLAKKGLLSSAQYAVQTESSLNARDVIHAELGAVNDRKPILSAQENLDLLNELLPGVTIAEVNGAFQKHFEMGKSSFVVMMSDAKADLIPKDQDVLQAAHEAEAQKVEAVKEEAAPTQILEKLPSPGKVVESTLNKDFEVTSAWLDNGVRIHHRYMDYKKDTVYVSISLAGGRIEEMAENAGITQVSALAVNQAATSKISSSVMRDLMVGKEISVEAAPQEDAFVIRIGGSPKDLETGLQEAYALLTDGKIEDSAFQNWKIQMLQQIESWKTSPKQQAVGALEDLLSKGDPRRTLMTKERVEAQSLEKAQAWFNRLCREAPIEVAVVGDIPLEKAMALVNQYVGSLPKRSRTSDAIQSLRVNNRPKGPLQKQVDVKTVTPQGVAISGFAAGDSKNTHDRRALTLASRFLSSRLIKHIREDLSIVYSIGADMEPHWAYQDDNRWTVGTLCDPTKTGQVISEIEKILNDFSEKGTTDEEFANAKKEMLNLYDVTVKEPGYWMAVLAFYDLHSMSLDDEKIKRSDYEKFQSKEVLEIFKKYYVPERKFEVTAIPVK